MGWGAPMKIAVWHNLPSGGGKRALYSHVRGLVQRGHTVECWCPSTADEGFLPLREWAPVHVHPLRRPRALRARTPLGRLLAPYRLMAAQLAALEAHCRACADEIAEGDFDLLFANSCRFFRVPPIGRFTGLPAVLYLQEPYRPLYEALPRLPWPALPPPAGRRPTPAEAKGFLRDAVEVQALRVQAREERRNAAAFARILVNSLYSRESVLRAYGLDARVCYLGVDTAQFAPRDVPRARHLLGLGAFVPEKNIAFVLRAVARLPAPRPPLVWVGNVATPGHLAALEDLARRLAVPFQPEMRVLDDRVVHLLNTAALLVYAPRLEPFGYAPLEASACGLPVVAVAEGGVRETVLDGVNGLLAEPDEAAFAAAVARVLGDPALACRLGTAGRALVETRWSLDGAVDRVEAALRAVVEAR